MQVLVVGAGVVGLAVARAAALAGPRGDRRGSRRAPSAPAFPRATARSSMPACIIRPARCARTTARAGGGMLYEFCASHGVPHRKCGKLIVATNESESRASGGDAQAGRRSTASKASRSSAARPRARLEPELACVGALHSPETGIIDSHGYMLALRGDLEDRGGVIAFNTPVERLRPGAGGGWDAASAAATRQWLSLRRGGQLRRARRASVSRARSRVIRPSACRGWCWPRAIISASPAGRRSRG